MREPENLPNDVDTLKKIIVEQASTIRGFQETLRAEQEKYAALQRLIFGPKCHGRFEFSGFSLN